MSPFSLSVSNPASGHSGQSWKRIADALRGEGVSLTRKMPQIVSSRCVAAKLSGQRSSEVRDHHVGTQRWTAPDQDAGVGRRSSVVGRNSSSFCSITARKTIPCSCTTRSSTFNGGPRCTTFWVASLPTLPKEAWRSEPRRAVQANMQEVMARGLWKCESPVLRFAQPGQVQALASLVLPAALFFVVVSESLPSTPACYAYRNRLQETGLAVLNKIAVGARCSAAPGSSSCVPCPCLTLAHWRAPAFAFRHRHGSFFYGQKENRSTTLTFNEASVFVLGIEVSAACPSPFPPRHCTLVGKRCVLIASGIGCVSFMLLTLRQRPSVV